MTRILGTTALALAIGSFALPAAGQQNQASQNQAAQNACWEQLARFDNDKDGAISSQELAANKGDIFAALNRDGDGEITREEYMRCFSAQGGKNRIEQTFTELDRDQNQRLSQAEFSEGDRLERTQVMVEQRQPEVTVQQPQATVSVDQKQPTVNVAQPQPEVTVQQRQPTVNVTQPQPEVTVQQAQPQVQVEQPQPEVTVQQAEPKVTVQQAEPKVQVQQAEPKVQVQQAEPKVQVQQAEPKVQVQQTDPKVNVERQQAANTNERMTPDQQRAAGQQNAANRDNPAATATTAQAENNWADGKPIQMDRMRAEELLGRDIVNRNGEDVGDIEQIVVSRNSDEMFAVVSVGGFLGLGAKDVVLPFSELRMGEDNMILMSEKSEDGLRELPAYDENQYKRYQR